jgi:hypothetical protein
MNNDCENPLLNIDPNQPRSTSLNLCLSQMAFGPLPASAVRLLSHAKPWKCAANQSVSIGNDVGGSHDLDRLRFADKTGSQDFMTSLRRYRIRL